MVKTFLNGDIQKSMQMQAQYLPLISALFCECNPIPVKAAMSKMGFCEDFLRLPLTPMEEAHRQTLYACMKAQGLI
jgi:4-hydroxy-tetrahydrodipicolinate synthase